MLPGENLSGEQCAALIALAREAGAEIMAIYAADDGAGLQFKADASPLTAADLAAHHLLVAGLPAILDIPIISEESGLPPFTERSRWERYWLIDPLDGTREFVERNGEFTVNIALIEQGAATLGVVHVPVTDVTYIGINPADENSKKALKYYADGDAEILRVRPLQPACDAKSTFKLLVSHRYGTDAVADLTAQITRVWPGEVFSESAGSSLKFCVIAEGKADFYPRLAPTSEWDTAAAQAVLEAAGGAVVNAEIAANFSNAGDWPALRYNARESIINPSFYALGDAGFDWPHLLLSGRK